MGLYQIIEALVIVSAIFAYINKRVFKLPITIGLMFLSTLFSFLLLLVHYIEPGILNPITTFIHNLDFTTIVLDILLSFLLFAGAMHTDFEQLKENRISIILFAFFSVLISTFLIGTVVYYVSSFFGAPINFLYCLLFGALISPTDPIAVLGILNKVNVPQQAKINIVGESLFNDGIGVVIFVTLLTFINKGVENVSAVEIPLHFLKEAGGGVVLGLVLGYIIFYTLKSIDDYEIEVMITLAAVMLGNMLAQSLHVSGPLAMVVAGLMTGHKAKSEAMSQQTSLYVDKFWHLIDSLMNSVLFVLIGLKILSIKFEWNFLWIGLIVIPLLILSRYIALSIPFQLTKKLLSITNNTVLLMTWGGLRGGLSIAMVLSLSESVPVKDELVFITYIIVMFSIFIQGLSIEKVAKRIYKTQE
ncbi:MAG: sodium:proton antiporter [Chitinophagaceae bacterium]|nr:sodium:proton antiporter [Chitinophagaceae bacterium]